MQRWIIDGPQTEEFDGIVALKARLGSGHVDVITADGPPRLEVTALEGPPLLVTHQAGILTVTYEDLTWEGISQLIRPRKRSATISLAVPAGCPVDLTVANASVVVAGPTGRTSVRSMSGDVTLDGLTARVDVNTVSGDIAARGLAGDVILNSASGRVELADAGAGRVGAKTVSGRILTDVRVRKDARIELASLSGDITLRVPSDIVSHVELRSTRGKLESAFPTMHRQDGRALSRLVGDLGDGSTTGRLAATSVSGDVTLLRDDTPALGEAQ
ncbi:MAG: DUF4097 family beta strand repeat protein [Streptosporangiales bacterium]|nr:DUF4097 family beta strand repeat protein [Streptosporangiales bacterium]